ASQSVVAGGGTGSTTVTAPTGCAWTAVSNDAWITVTTGASGSGNGSVTFSVAANTAGTSRTGTLTVAGNTFTVTQAGVPCTSTLAPASQAVAVGGGSGTVTVTAPAGCSWTATTTDTWITIKVGGGRTGNGITWGDGMATSSRTKSSGTSSA